MSRRHRTATYAGLALAAAMAVGGCDAQSTDTAGSTDTTTSSPPTSTPTSPGESTSPGDSPDTTPTTPTASEPTTRDDSSTARARRSQVPPRRMPGFNDEWTWDGVQTWSGGPAPKGVASSVCQRASLTAIGGVVEFTTAYSRSDAPLDAASVTTAVFPDERTATMAESVLSKWLATCGSTVRRQPGVTRVKVSDDSTVDTVVGPGHQRLVSYGPVDGHPDDDYFNGEGYVRDGDVISYVVFHSVGQDYNYPAGQQPADLGVRVAATFLKRSR